MRNRVLLSAGAVALLAASCAQPEPQVLSEAPRSASTAELTSPSQSAEAEAQQGRFIARCATEADGGTPGMTFFTDGSQNVTDHCLSRYYIGVQPAPGALYVRDEEAGSLAPSTRESENSPSSDTSSWTPAQPRTDSGPESITDAEDDLHSPDDDPDGDEETSTTDTSEPGAPDSPTSPDESPTSPTTTTPGTSAPGTSEPDDSDAGTTPPVDEETSPTGSTETTRPTEVPTETAPDALAPNTSPSTAPGSTPTSVRSARSPMPFGSFGSHS
ncbi:MAG: hypothetical protein GX636_09245 [Actinomycetales bacterium]|nr:hypothetical protein [Actinomycetales bacterium]